MRIKISETTYQDLREDYSGICIKCLTVRHGDTEPDAQNYPCDNCGENKVQGIEDLLIMGLIEFVDEGDDNIEF